LNRQDAQARDTIRKHHLADIERSLYADRLIHHEFPPYGIPQWCGTLNEPKNAAVRSEVEAALRKQNEKYANPAKPFATDPKYANTPQDYFYIKHSPTMFELYATLEAAKTGAKNSRLCANATPTEFDYGLSSIDREFTLGVPQ
ncbi:MAG: hypothetical protein HYZ63_02660, partial [Candidatus Andersenbacteria bacterium]|nr:hypothetical protein [Candidatus Andersenbacteria bacterium]